MDELILAYGTNGGNGSALPANAGKCKGGIFVPVQTDNSMWPPEEALARGTVYPCLFDSWQKGEVYCE